MWCYNDSSCTDNPLNLLNSLMGRHTADSDSLKTLSTRATFGDWVPCLTRFLSYNIQQMERLSQRVQDRGAILHQECIRDKSRKTGYQRVSSTSMMTTSSSETGGDGLWDDFSFSEPEVCLFFGLAAATRASKWPLWSLWNHSPKWVKASDFEC